jgi:2-polyprenyl-3-methyl-5-hydroxy-6-metoxy-1,4-benzoquinol methylase
MSMIEVAARSIEYWADLNPRFYRTIIFSKPAAVEGGNWDRDHRPVAENPVPQAIRDVLVKKAVRWEDTTYFAKRMDMIRRGHFVRGCHDAEELRARCGVVEQLFYAIEESGYKTQEQLGFPNKPDRIDDIRVAIGRNGEVLFLDGRHRFAIAYTLDLTIPVRVVLRHKQWHDFREKVHAYASRGKKHVYQKLDHPDLQSVNFGHGDERWPLIEPALRGYEGPALDLGAHWGHYSQKLAQLGISTTAVEESRSCCEFAREVARMPHSAFKVICGDLCETSEPESFRIVLALNIFHHFHKTRSGYERLEQFLRKLRPEVMIFEGHVQKPDGQMKDAYSDLPPQRFASWVAERVGLTTVEHLGDANDGRAIFKLS